MALLLNNPANTLAPSDGDFGYQDVLFTTPKVGTDLTGLVSATLYNATIVIDDQGQFGPDYTPGVGDTFDDLVNFFNNTYFPGNQINATALMTPDGAFRIVGGTRGPKGRIRIDDFIPFYVNKLFSHMTDFDSFDTPVDGSPRAGYQEVLLSTVHDPSDTALVAGTYTTEITINGIVSNVSVTTAFSIAYSDLAPAISADLSNGWCEFYRDRFIIHSNIGGIGTYADVNTGIDALFSTVTDFSAFGVSTFGDSFFPPHPEVIITPTSDARIEAGSVSITGNNASGFTDAGGAVTIAGGANTNIGGTGGGGPITIAGGFSDSGLAGNVHIEPGTSASGPANSGILRIYVGGSSQLEILGSGEWLVGGFNGSAGQVIASNGPGLPPSWQAAAAAAPIAGMIVGTPAPSGIVLNYVAATGYTIADDFLDSQAASQIAATASTTFDVRRNGVSFGSINFAASSSVATFSTAAGDEVFAIGDILTIVAPVVPDASLADIGITIVTS